MIMNEKSLIQKLGDPIWNNLYQASVRYKDSLSVDSIRTFGMPTVGDDTIDYDVHNQPLFVMITINDMVEYFKNGVAVTLRNNEDTATIYTIVNNYLLAWKQQLDNGINIGDAPFDDLVTLDEFATMLYPVALKFGIAIKDTGSLFANIFGSGTKYVSRTSFFGKETHSPKKPTTHMSLSKSFTRNLKESGGGGWK